MRFCSSCGSELPGPPPVTCPACGVQHWRNAKPCAGALVAREGRLLLVRRNIEPFFDHWDIPGGFCEADEHPMATARRETFEEAGLEVAITGFLGIWIDDYFDSAHPANPAIITLNNYYHAVVAPGSVATPNPDEVSAVDWFAPDDLPPAIAFPRHATLVLAAWRTAIAEGATVSPLLDRGDHGAHAPAQAREHEGHL